jgi:beta-mannanase
MIKNSRIKQFIVQLLIMVVLFSMGIIVYIHSNATANSITLIRNDSQQAIKLNQDNTPKINKLKFGIFTDEPYVYKDEQKLGNKVNIVGWFVHWNETMDSNKLKNTCAAGYVPEITWESWDKKKGLDGNKYMLDDILAGKYDKKINTDLDSITNACQGQNVIIRFDHEMDSPINLNSKITSQDPALMYYPWQSNPDKYIRVWQKMVTTSRNKNQNIKWVWSPNPGTDLATKYYPEINMSTMSA